MTELAIIVCVHDALPHVRACLASVLRHTPEPHQLILVDDGSASETRLELERFAREHPHAELLRSDTATGYTCAANRGLRRSQAELSILLNSDTIVSQGWATRLQRCAASDERIGIVGPLSNAATYQSVPELVDADGHFAWNSLPAHMTVDEYARTVARCARASRPRVPVATGFCFGIRRRLIDAIGLFDEEAFPRGYGEENDYCLRAADAGFEVAIADDAYVYHAGSQSYGDEARRELWEKSRATLEERHGKERLAAIDQALRHHAGLEEIRDRLRDAPLDVPAIGAEFEPPLNRGEPRILFLLQECAPQYGGTQVILETTLGLRRLGVDARVAVERDKAQRFARFYPVSPDTFVYYDTSDELVRLAGAFDQVVATIFHTVETLASIVERHPQVSPAYYVQDYEPRFVADDEVLLAKAQRSYTAVPNCRLLALSPWVQEIVEKEHGVTVEKVPGPLDTRLFHPAPPALSSPPGGAPRSTRIAAMIRPGTPWRGAQRTLQVMGALNDRFGERVEIDIFGAEPGELEALGMKPDFRHVDHGVLTRPEVARLLRQTDVFLDLSDFQAFGRTALEAMACGCAVVAPHEGGVSDFGVDGENLLLVDSGSVSAASAAASRLVEDSMLRRQLSARASETAAGYSIEASVRAVLALFEAPPETGSDAGAKTSRPPPA